MAVGGMAGFQQTTTYKVVLPFYAYGALSFLVATALLFFHTDLVGEHHFNPITLTITHIMALGWGTMVILGASHQLLPVLISGKLQSVFLGHLAFVFTAVGIQFLAAGFYNFRFDWVLKTGAILVNLGVICYLINVIISIRKSEKQEIHAWFMLTATLWLFTTTIFGLLLVFNYHGNNIFPESSLAYLSLHAHIGIIGWFLTLVFGVGSRLIPLFLISKYTSPKTLWAIYVLVNLGLISFIIFRLSGLSEYSYYVSILLIMSAVLVFGNYCWMAYKTRIRKKVDMQVRLSLISIIEMMLPVLTLIIVIALLPAGNYKNLAILYGFCIFFGWITAIILGMTFKTMPFIVWNKVYQKGRKTATSTPPAPKELFSENLYRATMFSYLTGFVLFVLGIIFLNPILLKIAAGILLITAVLYVTNVSKTLFHKA